MGVVSPPVTDGKDDVLLVKEVHSSCPSLHTIVHPLRSTSGIAANTSSTKHTHRVKVVARVQTLMNYTKPLYKYTVATHTL